MANNPSTQTTRVRIAVGVDRDGSWWAEGRSTWAHKLADQIIFEAAALYWIEADLPIPGIETVEGKATKA